MVFVQMRMAKVLRANLWIGDGRHCIDRRSTSDPFRACQSQSSRPSRVLSVLLPLSLLLMLLLSLLLLRSASDSPLLAICNPAFTRPERALDPDSGSLSPWRHWKYLRIRYLQILSCDLKTILKKPWPTVLQLQMNWGRLTGILYKNILLKWRKKCSLPCGKFEILKWVLASNQFQGCKFKKWEIGRNVILVLTTVSFDQGMDIWDGNEVPTTNMLWNQIISNMILCQAFYQYLVPACKRFPWKY